MGERLGQHFLHDPRIAARIADAVAGEPAVLEVGGGRGALTEHLAGRVGRLVVVELDRGLAAGLERRFGESAEVVQADVLDLSLSELGAGPWVVVGNLPYYCTSDILIWLCEQTGQVGRAVLMLQDEVVDRLLAAPGGKAYGRLTCRVRYHAEVRRLFRVGSRCFDPPPKVLSAVVELTFRPAPAVAPRDPERMFALIEHGFRWRRKALATVLKRWLPGGAEVSYRALASAGIDPLRRAETLDLGEFALLSDAVGDAENR